MKIHLVLVLLIGVSAGVFAQSVSTQSPVVAPGDKIIVSFSGFPAHHQDWLAIARPAQPDDQSLQWYYTGGTASGSVTFPALPIGEYEVRGYFKNEYTVRVRYGFSVGIANPDEFAKASTEKSSYTQQEKIVVSFSNFPGNAADWIAVAEQTQKDDQSQQWLYTEGKRSGALTFNALPPGTYEVRGYFNNGYTVMCRSTFTVMQGTSTTNTTSGTSGAVTGMPSTLCRKELSIFYAGIGGLGSAWGRAAHEPSVMQPAAIADMQAVIRNAKEALLLVKCVPYDVSKLDVLIEKLPKLSNVGAVAEIEATIKEIQSAVAKVKLDCGTDLMSLYTLGIHMGAAQAHASSRMCQAAPMSGAMQTVIFNHLKTAQDGFATFMPCVPGFSLPSITAVNLNSTNSVEPHIQILMIHTNVLWAIALSDCCCGCK